jgi:hypothetical protein
MRPERRFKPGMDGGLMAAVLVSPPPHPRTTEILSKRWGPPQRSPNQPRGNRPIGLTLIPSFHPKPKSLDVPPPRAHAAENHFRGGLFLEILPSGVDSMPRFSLRCSVMPSEEPWTTFRPLHQDHCKNHCKFDRRKVNLLILWSHPPGSNRRPADYESAALPAELGWRSLDSNNLRATEKGWFRLCARNVLDTPGPSPSTRACAIKFTAIHPMLTIAP